MYLAVKHLCWLRTNKKREEREKKMKEYENLYNLYSNLR